MIIKIYNVKIIRLSKKKLLTDQVGQPVYRTLTPSSRYLTRG